MFNTVILILIHIFTFRRILICTQSMGLKIQRIYKTRRKLKKAVFCNDGGVRTVYHRINYTVIKFGQYLSKKGVIFVSALECHIIITTYSPYPEF